MQRNILLSQRLREVFLSGDWIANTNWKTLIENTTWQQANQKIGDHNSIAALTYHLNYYLAGLLHAYATGNLEIRDKYSFDMPPIHSEEEWLDLVKTFIANAESFADLVANMEESYLDQAFINEKYGTNLRNIEGMIEHAYYHLGQVSLLKKLMSHAL